MAEGAGPGAAAAFGGVSSSGSSLSSGSFTCIWGSNGGVDNISTIDACLDVGRFPEELF